MKYRFLVLLTAFTLGTSNVLAQAQICHMSEEYRNYLSTPKSERTFIPNYCESIKANTYKGIAAEELPVKYNARDYGYVSDVKNQMQTNSCSSFSATTMLESYMKKAYNLDYSLSTRHMHYSIAQNFSDGINPIGYNQPINTGVSLSQISNLLASNYAPIALSDLPFENNENLIPLNNIQNKKIVIDTNNIELARDTSGISCTQDTITTMKQRIMEFGPIQSQIRMMSYAPYYNSITKSMYYNSSDASNHAITIIGWDDSYARSNFYYNNLPTNDGAWIVQNSYGTSFGDNGIFYVSYDDYHICELTVSIRDADSIVPDNSYIHDYLANNINYGYNDTEAYVMNIFETDSVNNETLDKITFYTVDTGSYKIYYKTGDASNNTIDEMIEIGSGTMTYNGFITHKLDHEMVLEPNSYFSIAIYLNTDSNNYPIAFTQYREDYNIYEPLKDKPSPGKSYISRYGYSWEDVYLSSMKFSVASIKAFTNNIDVEYQNHTIINDDSSLTLNIDAIMKNVNAKNFTFDIKDFNNEFVNVKLTDISLTQTEPNHFSKLIATFDHNLEAGTYNVSLKYPPAYEQNFSFDIYYEITSQLYAINQQTKIIRANLISPNVADFIANLSANTYSIFNNEIQLENTDVVGTGMSIGGYNISIVGDVTGDGLIKMNDVMKISKYIVDNNGLDDNYNQIAADVTDDGVIRMNDVMKISKFIVDGGSL